MTSSLLNGDSASLLRESNNVSQHIGDLLTVVHNLGAALVPLADQTPSGIVELTSGNIGELRVHMCVLQMLHSEATFLTLA